MTDKKPGKESKKKVPPHDRFFKKTMSDLDTSKAFFQRHLPPEILEVIDLGSLNLENEAFVQPDLRSQFTDMLFKANLKDTQIYIYLLVEHFSTRKSHSILRLWQYMLSVMLQHAKSHKPARYPIVFPMIYYHGKRQFGSTDLVEYVEGPKELMRDLWLKPLHLVDPVRTSDETIMEPGQDLRLIVMNLLFKHIRDPDIKEISEDLAARLSKIEKHPNGVEFVESALQYLLQAANTEDPREIVETLTHDLSEEAKEKVMTIAEALKAEGLIEGEKRGLLKGEKRGLLKGEKRGRLEGRLEGKEEIARNMLKEGYEDEDIVRIVNISPQTLAQLKNEK